MSRSLDDLTPEMKQRVLHLLTLAENEGLSLLVYCTRRTMVEQSELYQQGRTTPGRIVTMAKPGQSAHNYGLAIDAVPLFNGKPLWENKHPQWQRYGTLAVQAGLEWAGHWTRFKEYPHAEMVGFNWREMIE